MRGRYACGMEYQERIAAVKKQIDGLAEQLPRLAFLRDHAPDEAQKKSAATEWERKSQQLANKKQELYRLETAERDNRDPDTGLPL